jgi:YihY family inner membrane protein
MSGRSSGVVPTAKRVRQQARKHEITFLAAGVAYYAFVSIFPLLLLLLVVATFVGGQALADRVAAATGQFLSPTGQNVAAGAIQNAQGRGVAGVVSLLLLVWSGLKLFRGLDETFSRVYNVTKGGGLLDELRDGLVVLVAIGLAAVAVVALGGVLPALFAAVPFAETLSVLAIVPVLVLFFLPIYYIFPDLDLEVRDAVPGAVLAAVGWTALTQGFRVYAESASTVSLYGAVGTVILFVTFLYLASIIIILGAVVNAVLAGRYRDGEQAEGDEEEAPEEVSGPAPDIGELAAALRRVERDLDEKTVRKSDLEGDLRQYVEKRFRRGHARGWGPYLVLLYGTAMTLGAFYWLSGGWSILAMVVVWLSTLGLYALMLLAGVGFNVLGVPRRAADWVKSLRS